MAKVQEKFTIKAMNQSIADIHNIKLCGKSRPKNTLLIKI